MTKGFDLDHDLDLEFSRSNMEFPISQPKVIRLPRNEKQTTRLNPRPQMWPMGLTFTITLTFEFWRSNVTLTFDHTIPWPWFFMVKFWNSCISEWEGRLTLHKKGGSRSFMTMTMKIWWPSSGCIDLPDSDRGDFSCQRAVDSSSLITEGVTIFNRYPETRWPRRHVQWKLCEFASFVL